MTFEGDPLGDAEYGLLRIENCVFRNIRAPSSFAGVIESHGHLNIKGCTFDNNYAQTYGSAIHVAYTDGKAQEGGISDVIEDCTFENHEGNEGLIAIRADVPEDYVMVIKNTVFKNNKMKK